MSDAHVAPGGGEGISAPVIVSTPASESPAPALSPRDAGRALAQHRNELRKKAKETPAEPESAPAEAAPEPPQELADEASAAQPEQADPGEATATPDPEPQVPPIEPPRSWTKEAKERWQSLPRETQEYIAQREQERDREIRRSQNDHAEKLKGLTAKEQQVEQARQQYEAALPALLQTLQDQQAGEFADIKSMEDVQRLSRDDPFRYLQWDASQRKLAAVQQEMRAAQARQAQEWQTQFQQFASKQDELFADKVPELADPAQKARLQSAALDVLKEVGFEEAELGELWNGQKSLSLRDHRIQLLIRDGIKFRDAQEAAKKAQAKPLPPVQRPGVAQPRSAASDAQIQSQTQRLEQSGSLKDAAKLLALRRAARR